MRLIKKVTITIIIAVLLTVTNMCLATFEISEVDLYSKGTYGNLLKYNGIEIVTTIAVYEKDGIEYPAYCLDKTLPGVEDGSYTSTITGEIENQAIWRVIINGYPYKTPAELGCNNEIEAFTATKQAVYCINHGNDINQYEGIGEAGERTKNALVNIITNAMNSTETKPSPNVEINEIDKTWNIDEKDSRYISKRYKTTAGGNISSYDLNIEGNSPEGTVITDINNTPKTTFEQNEEFKILIPILNLTNEGNFNIEILAQVKTKPILYAKAPSANLQDYALSGSYIEIGEGIKEIEYYKNATKIIIIKQEEGTEEKIEGAEFNLLDENKNIVYKNLKSDEDGKIILENILPGKYYLEEIKAPEGYNIYTGLLELNVQLNEELTVIVNNSKEKVTEIKNTVEIINVSQKQEQTTQENIIREYQETTEKEVIKLPKTGY